MKIMEAWAMEYTMKSPSETETWHAVDQDGLSYTAGSTVTYQGRRAVFVGVVSGPGEKGEGRVLLRRETCDEVRGYCPSTYGLDLVPASRLRFVIEHRVWGDCDLTGDGELRVYATDNSRQASDFLSSIEVYSNLRLVLLTTTLDGLAELRRMRRGTGESILPGDELIKVRES